MKTQVAWLAAVFGGLLGCGSLHPKLQSHGGGSANATAATVGTQKTFAFTANYQMRPLDVIIIRDGSSHADPIGRLLDAAMPVLSARLWNLVGSVGSVHVGVFDHYWRPSNTDPTIPVTGVPVVDASDSDQVLHAESMTAMDFNTAMTGRVDLAGTRGGQPSPATVLLTALAQSNQPGGGNVPGLFRPDAYWAILFIGATFNPNDPNDVSDVTAALQNHQSGYAMSALTYDKGGCTFPTTNPPRASNPDNLPMRNLELKLQQATSGIFGSVCNMTYALFMDDFAQKGTGTQYFAVTLPTPVKAETISILGSDNAPVKDFRYIPGSTTLEISTLVASGESFVVQAVPDAAPAVPVVMTSPGDPDVPEAGQAAISPAQQAFLTNVEPVLQRDCGGCHGGRPFDTNGGYASAMAYRSDIARRIQLPTTDMEHMPQNSTLPDADKAAILTWAAQ